MFFQLELINESPYTFPVLECLHIAGIAIGAGTIAVVDFRLLGFAMPSQSPSAISEDLSLWTMFGIGLTILAGAGLFASDPDMYYTNHAFQAKMVLLILALLFHYTIHQRKVSAGSNDKWVAVVSLLLWASVIFGGIFIAFVGDATVA